ncbi:MAG: TolC family protein [Gammaproteobacteria bacterium]|nr:TolC family protein [Gammaproteobacteria bacterium]
MPIDRLIFRSVAPLVAAALSGCAVLPADRGAADVRRLVAERGGRELAAPEQNMSALVGDLLKAPLTADSAVQIALLNNPRVRAEYARLGLAGADVYEAGRLSNPRFSVGALTSNAAGAATQVTFGLAQSFTDLLLLPARSRLAAGEFERAKQTAGRAILNVTADVESAYFNLIGMQQVVAMRVKIASAAQASAELAQRLFDAGNVSARGLAQEQAAASTAQLSVLQVTADTAAARTQLNELLGLGADAPNWQAASVLPAPLDREDELVELQKLAAQSRLDLAAQRREVALLADSLSVTRRYRYVGAVEVGVVTERETDRSRITGPTLSLELPIFNQGAGRVARAEALVEQAESALKTLELTVANKVRLAADRVRAARERAALLRTRLIPQREEVVRRTQQEVSYMLEGQFALLLVKQQEYDAYQGYLEAVRDYWIARTELAREVGARLPSQAPRRADTSSPNAVPEPLSELPRPGPANDEMKALDGMKMHDMPMPNTPPAKPTDTSTHQHGGSP